MSSNGPYFEGQESSSCGHYHPDVLRVADKLIGRFHVRIIHCSFCGVYGIDLHSWKKISLAFPHPISKEMMVDLEKYRQEWHKQQEEQHAGDSSKVR